MDQRSPPLPPARARTKQDLFSDERLRRVRLRHKLRRLTQLCLDCEDLKTCAFGQRLVQIHQQRCKAQVGDDFWYCAKCAHSLGSYCAIDQAQLATALHEQLGRCTEKRGWTLPLPLIRFDILDTSRPQRKPV